MSTQKTRTPEDLAKISAICRQLSNPKKLTLVQYLSLAGLATAAVIQRKLQFKQSATSKYLNDLTECHVLTKEKIGYSVVFSINQKTWSLFNSQLTDLST